jgi:putative glutamine amidotransferase
MIKIGIPVRLHKGRYVVNAEYVFALEKAHAETVLILPNSDLTQIIPTLQGILIPGGVDVDPSLYGESLSFSEDCDSVTDVLDIKLIKAACEAKLEIFGICRGLQILNVALGGNLIQDIAHEIPSVINHSYSMIHTLPLQGHLVRVLPQTKLAKLLPESIEVNTYHHQAIKKLAEGLSVSALADDGIIEAVEGNKILAVQWHPERMTSDPLFQNLFDEFVKRCSL